MDLSRILPKDMASQLEGSVTTADKIAAPFPAQAAARARRPWQPLTLLSVEKWTGGLKAAFELLAPQAVYLASPDRPVSVALLSPEKDDKGGVHVRVSGWKGGNPFVWQRVGTEYDREDYLGSKGCWPVRIGTTGWHRDAVSRSLPKDPYVTWGLRRRVWVHGLDEAWALAGHATERLKEIRAAEGAEALPHGYVDAGPLFTPYKWERDLMLPVARELGVKAWSEEGLKHFLERGMKRAVQRYGKGGPARRHFAQVCEEMIAEEADEEAKAHALEQRRLSELGEPIELGWERKAIHPVSFPVKEAGYKTAEIAREIEEALREKALQR